jgi:hypothetical protein
VDDAAFMQLHQDFARGRHLGLLGKGA